MSEKRFLVKHVGNMGDMIFFVPPVLETLKKKYPDCHITFVTAWGFKDNRGRWGKRNQSGFCISLMMTNPHVDQLVHWSDKECSLEGGICFEDGQWFPTWSREYYEKQKESGEYDGVYELDFGIGHNDDPIKKMYEAVGMPQETYSNYKIYLTNHDREVARAVTANWPNPRIVLLEGLAGTTTRGWDPDKVNDLERAIYDTYSVEPIWFGGQYAPHYEGQSLTLRENIATLEHAQVAIGVLSGTLHMAAAVGLPTITLYCDQPLYRAAPAYFLNNYINDDSKKHRTILGPDCLPYELLKSENAPTCLTPQEKKTQKYRGWQNPGRQSTKSCLGPITVSEVMTVLREVVKP